MYVCLCTGVTEDEVVEALEAGASTVEEVSECTGAGTRCGSCVHRLAHMVNAANGVAATSRPVVRLAVVQGMPAPSQPSA